ncbi:GDSL-type esterase/lipase family protein [Janibacter melonis]|uniref:GDSL-type esterase/lipase family protein n=1 Tax=Janibacter melonis TaxID=262209 RepID=UPI0019185CF8|nr:GDSL-type esterase/lipase family protein [Janibacter melonis]
MSTVTAVPFAPGLVRGHDHLETTSRGLRPHRLPEDVTTRFPDPQLLSMQAQPSGVRVAMTTTAGVVELVTHPTRTAYRGLPRPRGQVDLVVDGALVASDELTGGDTVLVDLATRSTQTSAGEAHVSRFEGLPAGEKRVELWLPHNEVVDLVELRADAPVAPVEPVGPRWLHHGSSISQGSNATSPARTWPSLVARGAGVELRNLGLGGSALVDPFMARVMRDTPADLVSVALGINVVNGDVMRLRSFVPAVHGFLDTIRDGHPTTPLVLVTPIHCGIHEDTSGPGAFDVERLQRGEVRFVATGPVGGDELGRLTLRRVREALAEVVARRDDPHLHLLDGLSLYGEQDETEHPLPDALHPDTQTHEVIATRFAERVFGEGGPFAGER